MATIGLSPIEDDEGCFVPLTVHARRIRKTGELELRVVLPASSWPDVEPGKAAEFRASAGHYMVMIMRPFRES